MTHFFHGPPKYFHGPPVVRGPQIGDHWLRALACRVLLFSGLAF